MPASPPGRGPGREGAWPGSDPELWGLVRGRTWAEAHPQPPAGSPPPAATPDSSQSGHAAHRRGAARTRNLLSHSRLGGGGGEVRNAIQLPMCLFCLPGCLCPAGGPLPRSAGRPARLTPVPGAVPRFLCPTDCLARVGQVLVPAQAHGGPFSPSERPGFTEPSRSLRAASFSVLTQEGGEISNSGSKGCHNKLSRPELLKAEIYSHGSRGQKGVIKLSGGLQAFRRLKGKLLKN